MIQIDKNDKLYKYLTDLGAENVEEEYIVLAKEGRYNLNDVRQFYRQDFNPSSTEDVKEENIEKVLDYYVDLKNVKSFSSAELRKLLNNYKQSKDEKVKELIINSQLKDILYLCLNYSTLHKEEDIQDLVQIANMGLLQAIDMYKPEAKIDFKDYVIYYVRKSVKEFKEKING